MAYVVARRSGRFEIRESLHTPKGPRARSLASFTTLSGDVLAKAAQRATRPFDESAVLASAARARTSVAPASGAASPAGERSRRFIAASQRMARSMHRPARAAPLHADPGRALIDLLGFADAVRASQPPRPREPLAFPPLARLVRDRRAGAGAASVGAVGAS